MIILLEILIFKGSINFNNILETKKYLYEKLFKKKIMILYSFFFKYNFFKNFNKKKVI